MSKQGSRGQVEVKRIYDDPADADGWRVLVDRLWPRGVSKERAHLDEWLREVAPSSQLRTWFDHDPDRFEEFAQRYRTELESNEALERLRSELREHQVVTLLYAAKDPEVNHAVVLVDVLRNP